MSNHYDAIIIGAGMSGLGAGIRLSMFGKKVLIVEKHTVPGGLNSFYQRGKRKFDVGLHALTNFASKGERRKPLNRLLRQLRISHDDWHLREQTCSKILFPHHELTFTNDFSFFKNEVETLFPHQREGFEELVRFVESYPELDLHHPYHSAKAKVAEWIHDPVLLEMIFCPLLIYGSAWERDMDLTQFVVMFKSLYLQGFSRPEGGVRTIIETLLKRYREEGGELRYGAHVVEIEENGVRIKGGEFLSSSCVISSMGAVETFGIFSRSRPVARPSPGPGQLSFTECILRTERTAPHYGFLPAIIFYNNRQTYEYRKPLTLVDDQSAVVCCSDNFQPRPMDGEGTLRVTFLANHELWENLSKEDYRKQKEKVYELSLEVIKNCIPGFNEKIVFKDVFTPKTITRYTGHANGAVYGSPDKFRDGKIPGGGPFICGTDQGFLGIVGAILSGITVANLYGLGAENTKEGTPF